MSVIKPPKDRCKALERNRDLVYIDGVVKAMIRTLILKIENDIINVMLEKADSFNHVVDTRTVDITNSFLRDVLLIYIKKRVNYAKNTLLDLVRTKKFTEINPENFSEGLDAYLNECINTVEMEQPLESQGIIA